MNKEILDKAIEVFGDKILAKKWLTTPLKFFNNDTPMYYAEHHLDGNREVLIVLSRIEEGVYS